MQLGFLSTSYSALFLLGAVNSASVLFKPPACPSSSNAQLGDCNEECTSLKTWGYEDYGTQDCYDAVRILNEKEVYKHRTLEWEFLAPGARPKLKPSVLTMQTPRRYTSRTCTVAVVMLSFFEWGDLPGEDPRLPPLIDAPDSDLANFHEIWGLARRLEMWCLAMRGQLGWARVGRQGGIGIFLWSTKSQMNRHVPRGIGVRRMEDDDGRAENFTTWLAAHLNVSFAE